MSRSKAKEPTYLIVGIDKYVIPSIQAGLVYRVEGSAFKGVRESEKRKIVQEVFAEVLIGGHELIGNKEIPATFDTKRIRHDIHESENFHEKKTQSEYLKKTRVYWEERYSWDELVFMENFIETVYEIDGKVGDEWYRLFEIVRGQLPRDFPMDIAFSIMIENVLERRLIKYENKAMKEYFETHPEAVKQILGMQVPSDLPIWPDMGLETKHFIKYAQKLAEDQGLLRIP